MRKTRPIPTRVGFFVALAVTAILSPLSGHPAIGSAGSPPSSAAPSPPPPQSQPTVSVSPARAAICAGGVPEGPEETTITATVTDSAGHAVAGEKVVFTTDHEFLITAPRPGNGKKGHAGMTAMTDARGQARITLVSGDLVTGGHVIATARGVSGRADLAFEAPTLTVTIWNRDTGREIHGGWGFGDRLWIVVHETYRGVPVAHHRIHWGYAFWARGTTSKKPDYFGVGGEGRVTIVPDPMPRRHRDPFTNARGSSRAAYTAPFLGGGGWTGFRAADMTAYTKEETPPPTPPPADWDGWGKPPSAIPPPAAPPPSAGPPPAKPPPPGP